MKELIETIENEGHKNVILTVRRDGKLRNVTITPVRSKTLEKYKIYRNSTDNKSMVIEIVDERLINLTNGIVQGMSGSPILRDFRSYLYKVFIWKYI